MSRRVVDILFKANVSEIEKALSGTTRRVLNELADTFGRNISQATHDELIKSLRSVFREVNESGGFVIDPAPLSSLDKFVERIQKVKEGFTEIDRTTVSSIGKLNRLAGELAARIEKLRERGASELDETTKRRVAELGSQIELVKRRFQEAGAALPKEIVNAERALDRLSSEIDSVKPSGALVNTFARIRDNVSEALDRLQNVDVPASSSLKSLLEDFSRFRAEAAALAESGGPVPQKFIERAKELSARVAEIKGSLTELTGREPIFLDKVSSDLQKLADRAQNLSAFTLPSTITESNVEEVRGRIASLAREFEKAGKPLPEALRAAGALFDRLIQSSDRLRAKVAPLAREFKEFRFGGDVIIDDEQLQFLRARLSEISKSLGVNIKTGIESGIESVTLSDLLDDFELLGKKAAEAGESLTTELSRAAGMVDNIVQRMAELGSDAKKAARKSLVGSLLGAQDPRDIDLQLQVVEQMQRRLAELNVQFKGNAAQALKNAGSNRELADSVRMANREIVDMLQNAGLYVRALAEASSNTELFSSILPEAAAAIEQVEVKMQQMAKEFDFAQTQFSRSRLVLLSFTQTIQDLPFGIIGAANNIQQLALSLTVLASGSNDVRAELKKLVRDLFSLKGFLIPFAVTLITTAILTWERWGEKIKEIGLRFKGLSSEMIELKKSIEKLNITGTLSDLSRSVTDFNNKLDLLRKQIELIRNVTAKSGPMAGSRGFTSELIVGFQISSTVEKFVSSISEVLRGNEELLRIFAELSRPGADVEEVLAKISERSRDFGDILTDSQKDIISLSNELEAFVNILDTVDKAVTDELRSNFKEMGVDVDRLREAFSDVLDQSRTITRTVIDIGNSLHDLSEGIRDATLRFPEMADEAREAFSVIEKNVKDRARLDFITGELEKLSRLQTKPDLNESERNRITITITSLEKELRDLESNLDGRVIPTVEEAVEATLNYVSAQSELNERIEENRIKLANLDPFSRRHFSNVLELKTEILNAEKELSKLNFEFATGAITQGQFLRESKRVERELEALHFEFTRLSEVADLNAAIASLNTLKDALRDSADVERFAEVSQSLVEHMVALSVATGEVKESLSDELAAGLSRVNRRELAEFVGKLAEADVLTRRLSETGFTRLSAALESLSLGDLASAFSEVNKEMERLTREIEAAGESEEARKAVFESFFERFLPNEEVVEDLDKIRELLKRRFSEFAAAVVEARNEAIINAVNQNRKSLGSFFDLFGAATLQTEAERLRSMADQIRQIIETMLEGLGDKADEETRKVIDAMKRLADEMENKAAELESKGGRFASAVASFFANQEVSNAINSLGELSDSLLRLEEQKFEERKRILMEQGLTEEEAARRAEIASRSGLKRAKAIAKATIWIQGLQELSGLTASIATDPTIPFFAKLGLIALHTAATMMRIRQRISALDRVGSSPGTSAPRNIDRGTIVQDNPFDTRVTSSNRVSAAADRAADAVAIKDLNEKMDELIGAVKEGLRVDAEKASRIVETGLSSKAYVRGAL